MRHVMNFYFPILVIRHSSRRMTTSKIMFTLNERLKNDTIQIGRMELSILLLMNDRSLPWIILVPERDEVKEIDELSQTDRSLLIEEIAFASEAIRKIYKPDKINVGALGNLVPQLHVHVIGRFTRDRAWPGPIWGTGPVEPYREGDLIKVVADFRSALDGRIK
jgi:diadenosine tetraphosphate (Ap4A) HIT family hydrolase